MFILKRTHEEYISLIFEEVGDEYTVLGRYINKRSKIKMKHNVCGKEWEPNAGAFLGGTRCPICAIKKGSEKKNKRIKSNCAWCNKSIEIPKAKYKESGNCCSKSCAIKFRNSKNPKSFEVKCELCGKEFTTFASRVKKGQGRFCSRECFGKFSAEQNESWRHFHTEKAAKNREKYYEKIHSGEIKKVAWNKHDDVKKTCRNCKKEFVVSYRDRDVYNYCSKECSLIFIKNRTGERHPLYSQVKRECLICGTEFHTKPANIKKGHGKLCSIQCVGAYTQKMIGGKRSSIEIKLEVAMNDANIPFEPQFKLGRWICDFGIPSHNIIIECDGVYWHNLPKQKEKDARKNKDVHKKGWKILRFWENEINDDIEKCIERIINLLNEQKTS